MTTTDTIHKTGGASSPVGATVQTFTLVFPGGLVAVLEVRGVADEEAALAIAEQAVRHRRRISVLGDLIEIKAPALVLYGDVSGGRAVCVCSWTCTANECQPKLNRTLGCDGEEEQS
jgi:hypothetical protein